MDKKKRKGYNWKPATHRWVRDRKNKWLTNSSFWYPKKKKLRKSIGGEDMISSPLLSLFEFLNKQSPEVASRMAARGLIWSPERHRWIRKPDVANASQLPSSNWLIDTKPRYAQQGFGSIGAPAEPEKPALTGKGAKLAELGNTKGLSDWEKEFLSSIQDQFKKKGSLSDKQWAVVEKIASKHEKQDALESGEIEAQPLSPIFDTLDKLKEFMPEKHVQAIESMANQVKAGSTLSPKQEDYLQIIEKNAVKQKKGMTEPASGNIIIRSPKYFSLHGWGRMDSLLEISGKGAFHPQGRKWLEDNGFKWAGPMSGKMYLPLTDEMKKEFIEEAKQQVGSPEGNENYGQEFDAKVRELIQNHIDEKMEIIPQLRDKGFTLKRSASHIAGYHDKEMVDSTGSRVVYSNEPKIWKMLLGRK